MEPPAQETKPDRVEDDSVASAISLRVTERGELIDEESGGLVGRIVGIELEIGADFLLPLRRRVLLAKNNNVKGNSNVENQNTKEPFGQESSAKESEPPTNEPSAEVLEVWATYSKFVTSRRSLGPKQRKDIERALKLRPLETVKQAVIGLARSPHHNGRNDTGVKYLDIRYALRGNSQRGETPEERIDHMAALADQLADQAPAPQLRDRGLQQFLVDQWTGKVRFNSGPARYGEDWDQATRDNHDAMRARELALGISELETLGISTSFVNGRPVFEDIR